MARLKPWVTGPYELLRYAELHRNDATDSDRRMALVHYDNAIELSISTYLGLDPLQRAGRSFPREQVTRWLVSYHSKLEFLECHVVQVLKQEMLYPREEIIFYHRIRNDLYHANGVTVPRIEDVDTIREIAMWVFTALYDVEVADLLRAEAAGESLEVTGTREPAPENQVLAALLELRKDIAQLKIASSADPRASDEHVLNAVLRSEQRAVGDRLKDALRQANEIAADVRDEKPVSVHRAEIDALIALLQQLKQRIEIPLRAHQKALASRSLEATLAAVEIQRHFIGTVYQSTGSGLTTTALAYLSMLCEHPAVRDFGILVVSDRRLVVDQFYHRVSEVSQTISRRVLRATSQTLGSDISPDTSSVVVTTVQALRVYKQAGYLPPRTLLIALNVELREQSATKQMLFERYAISFTNHLDPIGAQGELIGAYTLEQAQADGVLIPLSLEVHRPNDIDPLPLPESWSPSFDDDRLETPAGRNEEWAESRVRAVAELVVDHFMNKLEGGSKAIVMVRRLDDAVRFAAELRRELSERNGWPATFVGVLSSGLAADALQTLLAEFQSSESEPSMLICGRWWIGMDLSIARCAYLTCRLGPSDLRMLAGQLTTPRAGKQSATIVDFAGSALETLSRSGNESS